MKKILCLVVISFGLIFNSFYSVRAAEEPIKIGAIYSLTGETVQDDIDSLQGVRFAVDEINHQGGILGRKIELTVFDSTGTPIGAKLAAEKANKAGVAAIIGAAWSSHSLAVAKVAQEAGLPMITNVSTLPEVTKIGNYIFRACFIDPFQAKVAVQFVVNELKAKTAVIITNVSSDYSMGLVGEFRKSLEAMGGEVLLELKYTQKERDFKELLEKAKQVLPDILFIPGYSESGIIAKQAQDIGIKAVLVGGDGWGGDSFYDNGGKEINQGFYTTHWSEQIDRKNVQDFVQRYRTGKEIIADTALAYDAVFILAEAIIRAGSLDRKAIREALAQTKHFQGLTGDISLDENRNPIKSVVIIKIINGKPHYYKTIEPF